MKEDVRDLLFGVKLYCQNVQVLCFSDDRISKRHKGIQMIYSLYIFNKIKFPVANSTFKITRVKGPAGKVWVHSRLSAQQRHPVARVTVFVSAESFGS